MLRMKNHENYIVIVDDENRLMTRCLKKVTTCQKILAGIMIDFL
ncbi:hypothetical protein SAMN04488553_0270 [Gramella sp. MAR_2010_147]|nr:hypothetical protein SAMN04488553_0270 [Gramella sp. MAR_2010_147]